MASRGFSVESPDTDTEAVFALTAFDTCLSRLAGLPPCSNKNHGGDTATKTDGKLIR